MSRPKAHQIDTRAKKIFEAAIPDPWMHQEQHSDYHIDYRVELYSSGERTGVAFQVQLKGQTKPEASGGHVGFRLERKHLAEYIDRIHEPVFLVVVNVSTGECYWLFTQGYVEDHLAGIEWRKPRKPSQRKVAGAKKVHRSKSGSKITLRIPEANLLSNIEAFRMAVEASAAFMVERHPTSVEAAVKAAATRLESVDDRFGVEVEATRDKKTFTLKPKKSVSLGFQLTGKGQKRKYAKLIEDGLPVHIRPDEVKWQGSPLFDLPEVAGKSVIVQVSRNGSGSVNFRRIGRDGSEVGGLFGIPFTIEGGTRTFRIRAILPSDFAVISFNGTMDKLAATFNFKFKFSSWYGLPVLDVPGFEPIESVFGRSEPDEKIYVEFCAGGQLFKGGTFIPADQIGSVSRFLNFVSDLRKIAGLFRVNPKLPNLENFSSKQFREIEVLSALVAGEKCATSVESFEYSVLIHRNELPDHLEKGFGIRPVPMRVSRLPHEMEFLGQSVTAVIDSDLEQVQMKMDRQALVQQLGGDRNEIEVRLAGAQNSPMTFWLTDPTNPTSPAVTPSDENHLTTEPTAEGI